MTQENGQIVTSEMLAKSTCAIILSLPRDNPDALLGYVGMTQGKRESEVEARSRVGVDGTAHVLTIKRSTQHVKDNGKREPSAPHKTLSLFAAILSVWRAVLDRSETGQDWINKWSETEAM